MAGIPRGRRQAGIIAALLVCLLPGIAALAAPLSGFGLLSGAAPPGPTVAPGAHLAPPEGTTSRISVSSSELQALGRSEDAQIAGGGRYVAFTSNAGNLVAGDSNGAPDIFVRDLQAGSSARLPLPNGQAVPAGGIADQPSISTDGRFVVFRYQPPSTASTTTRPSVLYLWERGKGTTQIGTGNVVRPREPAIAPDGSWVAFTGDPPSGLFAIPTQVYAWNRATGQVIQVSASAVNAGGNAASGKPSISTQGAFVAFQSLATNLAGTDFNPDGIDIFLKELSSGVVTNLTPVSQPPAGVSLPSRNSDGAVVSADGAYVAFATDGPLVSQDTNGVPDVYRWARESATSELVSSEPNGAAASGSSAQAWMSADGRYVTFASLAPNMLIPLPPGATPPPVPSPGRIVGLVGTQVYLRDMAAADTILISVTLDQQPTRTALIPSVSDDGRRVVFQAADTNLVQGDTNEAIDVFLRDLPPVFAVSPDAVNFGAHAVNLESLPSAITIGNLGWADLRVAGVEFGGANSSDFTVLADPCTGVPIPRGGKCTLTIGYAPTAAGTRSATLQISHNAAGSPRSIRLVGTATDARIELDPDVGPAGFVVTARGTGFPAGALIKLSWYPGMTPALPIYQADSNGDFRASVLVFHRDILGLRALRAEPAGAQCFPVVEARFLVVQSSGQPGAYSGGLLVGPNPIIRPVGNAPAVVSPAPSLPPCTPGSVGPGPVPSLIPGIATAPPATLPPGPIATPVPTAPPDVTGPVLSQLTPSEKFIYDWGGRCLPQSVAISVTAADPSGVQSVTLRYKPPGGVIYLSTPMTRTSGTSLNGTWEATIQSAQGWPAGDLYFYVQATDTAGNFAQYPFLVPHLPVTYCIS